MRKFLYAVIALFTCANVVLANDFFTASGVPSTGAALNSATMRGEFTSIQSGFDKMPTLTGNGNKVVVVNAGGTALTATTSTALPNMVVGTNIQAWDADLDALAALASTAGMVARTGASTFAVRTLTGTANEITVADGSGASAAPTFSLPTALTFTSKTVTGGTFASPSFSGTTGSGITFGGNLLFTDATYDIGASGATRPRDIFLSRNAVVGGTLNVTGVATLGNGSLATTQSALENSTKLATTAYVDRMGWNNLTEWVSTSGASNDWTVPTGAKEFKVMFAGFSTNGTSDPLIQFGDAGGIEATDYLAGSYHGTAAAYTTGFGITGVGAAAGIIHGTITCSLENAATFMWTCAGTLYRSDSATVISVAGRKATSQELSTVRVTTVGGTDAADAGVVNVGYRY